MTKRIILVLGCHRSGTSLIAKSTECLGAELGVRANWNGPDNVSGFQEDLDVLAINEAVLKRLGVTWDEPTPWPIWEAWPVELRQAALLHTTSLLRKRLDEFPLFSLKEPRLCRLLSLWRNTLGRLGCEVSVVHAVRHPMAVADSLTKRNGIPTEKGLALWLEYNRCARLDVDPTWKHVTVDYDMMMRLPVQQVRRMSEALGLPIDEDRLRYFATHFVDDTLWHEIPDDDRRLPLEVAAAWGLIRKEAVR
jgi:hypothetical protein